MSYNKHIGLITEYTKKLIKCDYSLFTLINPFDWK